jgi:glycosyltransferase involved in cell wall biosynthesis
VPLVSIITPTYNHERFIEECVSSALNQTFTDWEMIVIDDGSTDATADRANWSGDERVRVVRQESRGLAGLAETYNRALREAKGELVAILEGDDLWPPEKLSVQVPDFADPDVVVSAGQIDIIDENGQFLLTSPQQLPPEDALSNSPVGRASVHMLSHKVLTFAYPVSLVIRKNALERIGCFHQTAGMPVVDYPTLLRLGLEGRWTFHTQTLGCWRRHGESTTLARFPRILNSAYETAAAFYHEKKDRLPLEPEEADRLDLDWSQFQFERLCLLGRLHADRGDWALAKACFSRAKTHRLTKKGRALVSLALLLTRLKVSPEPAFRAAGRGNLEAALSLSSGDPLVVPEQRAEEFPHLRFI